MSDRIRTAVVGYGFAGRCFHTYLVSLAPRLELAGVVVRRDDVRERAMAERGCRGYATLEAALDDPSIDLIVLATPNSTHADLAVQCLDAGKHVVTDKVMATSLADCDRMIAAAERNDRMLSVFQNRRRDGDFLTVQKLIAEGQLGDVNWVELAWQGFGFWGGWRAERAMGGGRYFDLGAHLVDQLCLLFPQALETVYGRLRWDFTEADVESEGYLLVTFAGGDTGIVDVSSLAAISKPRFYVRGNGGTFSKHGLDPQERAMIAGEIDAATEDPATFGTLHDGKAERVVPTLAGRWRDYYENIADVLLDGAEPLVSLASVRRQMVVLDAGLRSAESGQVVSVAGE